MRQHYLSLVLESHLEDHVSLFERALVYRSQIGAFSYIGRNARVHHATVGRFCSIGPGVQIGLGTHPTSVFASTHPIFYSTQRQAGVTFADRDYFDENRPVTIGHDVWIGANVVVGDGLTIGNGAIVGAGAVVAGDVAPYAVVGGVPARHIRYRFEEATIARLLASRWWERDPSWLADNFGAFHDVERLLALLERA